MSEYRTQFVSVICCDFLYADEYVTDMAMAVKSRVRKLTDGPFRLRLTVQDPSGETSVLETDETPEIRCPEELKGRRCTELPLEVTCAADCEAAKLKEEVRKAILDSSAVSNMTPVFFMEEIR